LVTTSEKGAGRWQKGVGLLRIDASHEYEDAKHDFLSWKQHLLPVVMVVLHDCDKPGLAQVVWEYLNPSGDFTTIQSVDTIIVAAKDKCTHYWGLDSKDIRVRKYCGKKEGLWEAVEAVTKESQECVINSPSMGLKNGKGKNPLC